MAGEERRLLEVDKDSGRWCVAKVLILFSASSGHEENLQKQVLQLNIYMKQDLDKQDQLEQKLQALHPAGTLRMCSSLAVSWDETLRLESKP